MFSFKGNFLSVKSNAPPYTYVFTFTQPIKVDQDAFYTLSFYSFFNCPRSGCELLGDKISIKYVNSDNKEFEVLSTGFDQGRYLDNMWHHDQKTVQFNSTEIYVREN